MPLGIPRPDKFVVQNFSARIQIDLRSDLALLLADFRKAKIA